MSNVANPSSSVLVKAVVAKETFELRGFLQKWDDIRRQTLLCGLMRGQDRRVQSPRKICEMLLQVSDT